MMPPLDEKADDRLSDLTDLARDIGALYAQRFGIHRDATFYLSKLTEEMGELHAAYLKANGQGRGQASPQDIADEAADFSGFSCCLRIGRALICPPRCGANGAVTWRKAMTPEQIEALFTRAEGGYAFARWGRPIAPVVIGVEDETLQVIKGAIEAVVTLAGHQMAETDPELGANLMVFFFREWDELADVPNMERLVPGLDGLLPRLKAADANQYRFFRFDDNGAIQAAFVFLRVDDALSQMPAEVLALSQAVQIIVSWSQSAFASQSPLAVTDGGATVLRPEIAAVIRAAYDPVMPVADRDAAHALRLFARLQLTNDEQG